MYSFTRKYVIVIFSSTLSHQGPAKMTMPVKAGSHNLYYHINHLNAEKNQPSGDLNPMQHVV